MSYLTEPAIEYVSDKLIVLIDLNALEEMIDEVKQIFNPLKRSSV
ncbi:hypothetical protein ACFCYN_04595 [Gottfriedia sp. NPDC056225]